MYFLVIVLKQRVSITILLIAQDKNNKLCCLVGWMRHNMKRIQSKLHRIGNYDACKISLSCSDDKRYILHDSICSLAYFHRDIM